MRNVSQARRYTSLDLVLRNRCLVLCSSMGNVSRAGRYMRLDHVLGNCGLFFLVLCEEFFSSYEIYEPGTCVLEASVHKSSMSNVSCARGYTSPYLVLGNCSLVLRSSMRNVPSA